MIEILPISLDLPGSQGLKMRATVRAHFVCKNNASKVALLTSKRNLTDWASITE